MAKTRTIRTSAELVTAWEHVAYEIEMYTYIRSLPSVKWQNTDNTGRALYESLAGHVRNLLDLLCLPGTKPADASQKDPVAQDDDIIASDYVPSWQPKWTPFLRSVRDSIVNKQVMHLTYKRVAGGTPWKWDQLWSELDPLLSDFLVAVNGRHGIHVEPETIASVQNNPGLLHLKFRPEYTPSGAMRTLMPTPPGAMRTLMPNSGVVMGPSAAPPRRFQSVVAGACSVASDINTAGSTTVGEAVGGTASADPKSFIVEGPTTTDLKKTGFKPVK